MARRHGSCCVLSSGCRAAALLRALPCLLSTPLSTNPALPTHPPAGTRSLRGCTRSSRTSTPSRPRCGGCGDFRWTGSGAGRSGILCVGATHLSGRCSSLLPALPLRVPLPRAHAPSLHPPSPGVHRAVQHRRQCAGGRPHRLRQDHLRRVCAAARDPACGRGQVHRAVSGACGPGCYADGCLGATLPPPCADSRVQLLPAVDATRGQ